MAIFSLTGIIVGMVLSLISPEEQVPGKKYFVLLRKVLFAAVSLFIISNFFRNAYLLLTFSIVLTALFILDIRFQRKWFYIIHYLLFLTSFFLISEQGKLILASLVFLYGFPVGTLIRINK